MFDAFCPDGYVEVLAWQEVQSPGLWSAEGVQDTSARPLGWVYGSQL